VVGGEYPPPIVDHALAARAAREALSGVRKSASHRRAADAIVQKHGSRKAGIPMTGRVRADRVKPAPATDVQFKLAF
jgi:deoxyribodipyrimidine photo-lyase